MGSLTIGSVLIGSFIACSVEVTEMVIIVVGVGTTRGWRSTLVGAGCGLAVLVALVAGLGQALSLVPIDPLRVAIGALLLTFGLQWLTSGVIGVAADGFRGGEEDEDVSAGTSSGGLLDWTAWLLSFKGVTLEGLEVAFIVIAFGAGSRGGQGGYLDAFVGAAAAFVIVGTAGALSINRVKHVPGRVLKFGVGGLISTFGTFWAMEGLGVRWPSERLSLAWLYAAYLGLTFLLVVLARRGVLGPAPYPSVIADPGPEGPLGLAPASAESVRIFQLQRGLRPTGDIDEPTRAAVVAESLERGVPVDGWNRVGIDPTDRRKIETFQRHFGLPVTGNVDGTTRGALRVLQTPGMFDTDNEQEVRAFQAAHDLDVTGQMDGPTEAAMNAIATAARWDPPGKEPGPAPDLLHAPGWVDPGEPASVRTFQRMLHLDDDGVVGDETRGALLVLRSLGGDGALRRNGADGRSAEAPHSYPVVDPTDREEVIGLQKKYGLAPDGAIGPKTRQALRWEDEHLLGTDVGSPESVRSFQLRHGLTPDGVVGPSTQAAMRAARTARQDGDGAPDERYGEAVQHAAGLGDGLDPADAESVRKFQHDHGLEADGIIGPATQAAMRALRAEDRGADTPPPRRDKEDSSG